MVALEIGLVKNCMTTRSGKKLFMEGTTLGLIIMTVLAHSSQFIVKSLTYLAILTMLLSPLDASTSTAEDTVSNQPPPAFSFCEIPRTILQYPTLDDSPQRPFAGAKTDAADCHRRKEKLGVNLAIAGGLSMLAGVLMVAATANNDGSNGRRSLGVFLGGVVLVPVGFALGVTGLTIYGIHRRKRVRAKSHF